MADKALNAIEFVLQVNDMMTPTLQASRKSFRAFKQSILGLTKNLVEGVTKALESIGEEIKEAFSFQNLHENFVRGIRTLNKRLKTKEAIRVPLEFDVTIAGASTALAALIAGKLIGEQAGKLQTKKFDYDLQIKVAKFDIEDTKLTDLRNAIIKRFSRQPIPLVFSNKVSGRTFGGDLSGFRERLQKKIAGKNGLPIEVRLVISKEEKTRFRNALMRAVEAAVETLNEELEDSAVGFGINLLDAVEEFCKALTECFDKNTENFGDSLYKKASEAADVFHSIVYDSAALFSRTIHDAAIRVGMTIAQMTGAPVGLAFQGVFTREPGAPPGSARFGGIKLQGFHTGEKRTAARYVTPSVLQRQEKTIKDILAKGFESGASFEEIRHNIAQALVEALKLKDVDKESFQRLVNAIQPRLGKVEKEAGGTALGETVISIGEVVRKFFSNLPHFAQGGTVTAPGAPGGGKGPKRGDAKSVFANLHIGEFVLTSFTVVGVAAVLKKVADNTEEVLRKFENEIKTVTADDALNDLIKELTKEIQGKNKEFIEKLKEALKPLVGVPYGATGAIAVGGLKEYALKKTAGNKLSEQMLDAAAALKTFVPELQLAFQQALLTKATTPEEIAFGEEAAKFGDEEVLKKVYYVDLERIAAAADAIARTNEMFGEAANISLKVTEAYENYDNAADALSSTMSSLAAAMKKANLKTKEGREAFEKSSEAMKGMIAFLKKKAGKQFEETGNKFDNLYLSLMAAAEGFERMHDEAEKSAKKTKSLDDTIKELSGQLLDLKRNLRALIPAMLTVSGIKIAGKLDSMFINVQQRLGATGAMWSKFRDITQDIRVETGLTLEDLNKIMMIGARRGFGETPEMMRQFAESVSKARIALQGLGATTDTLNTLAGYLFPRLGIEVEDFDRAFNQLLLTGRQGSLQIEDINQLLSENIQWLQLLGSSSDDGVTRLGRFSAAAQVLSRSMGDAQSSVRAVSGIMNMLTAIADPAQFSGPVSSLITTLQKYSGVTRETLENMVRTGDFMGAVTALITALQQIPEEQIHQFGTDLLSIIGLEREAVQAIRADKTILTRLRQTGQALKEGRDNANALNEAFGQGVSTLDQALNRLKQAAKVLGERIFLPAVTFVTDMLDSFNTIISKTSEFLGPFSKVVSALVGIAAMGGVLSMIWPAMKLFAVSTYSFVKAVTVDLVVGLAKWSRATTINIYKFLQGTRMFGKFAFINNLAAGKFAASVWTLVASFIEFAIVAGLIVGAIRLLTYIIDTIFGTDIWGTLTDFFWPFGSRAEERQREAIEAQMASANAMDNAADAMNSLVDEQQQRRGLTITEAHAYFESAYRNAISGVVSTLGSMVAEARGGRITQVGPATSFPEGRLIAQLLETLGSREAVEAYIRTLMGIRGREAVREFMQLPEEERTRARIEAITRAAFRDALRYGISDLREGIGAEGLTVAEFLRREVRARESAMEELNVRLRALSDNLHVLSGDDRALAESLMASVESYQQAVDVLSSYMDLLSSLTVAERAVEIAELTRAVDRLREEGMPLRSAMLTVSMRRAMGLYPGLGEEDVRRLTDILLRRMTAADVRLLQESLESVLSLVIWAVPEAHSVEGLLRRYREEGGNEKSASSIGKLTDVFSFKVKYAEIACETAVVNYTTPGKKIVQTHYMMGGEQPTPIGEMRTRTEYGYEKPENNNVQVVVVEKDEQGGKKTASEIRSPEIEALLANILGVLKSQATDAKKEAARRTSSLLRDVMLRT